jgi:S-adenosylmethionine-diacylgycerolhomoserine-N-methlytransferase
MFWRTRAGADESNIASPSPPLDHPDKPDQGSRSNRMVANMTSANATDLMDRIYRHQRHVYNFTRKYFLLGRDRMIAEIDAPDGARVLEIGCGTGRNLIMVARKYRGARCFGIDVSTEMLNSARRAISRAGLKSRVQLAHADATQFEPGLLFGVNQFDRIFISYSLSMIPQWQSVAGAAIAHLAPDGELRIIDFGAQERLPVAFRRLLWRWLSAFHVAPRDDLETTLRAGAAASGATMTFARPYGGYAQYAVLRR